MTPRRSPQEKKALSYARDGRNAYGENDKAARKAIPRRKRRRARAERRAAQQQVTLAVTDYSDEGIETADQNLAEATHSAKHNHWRKTPDIRLRDWVERKRNWRQAR